MARIFISHSNEDRASAIRIKTLLLMEKYESVFLDFDPRNGIIGGRRWTEELYSQVRSCHTMVFLSSQHSVTSQWCFAELVLARALGKRTIPIDVDQSRRVSIVDDLQHIDYSESEELLRIRLRAAVRHSELYDPSRPPYPGLASFDEEDAPVFFGRDGEKAEVLMILHRLRSFKSTKAVVIHGPSGNGKSSLLRAAIIPQLRKDPHWLVVGPFRPLDRPLDNLAKQLSLVLGDLTDELRAHLAAVGEEGHLTSLLRSVSEKIPEEGRLVIVIDQAEELLSLKSTSPSEQHILQMLIRSGSLLTTPPVLLCTLRSDFLSDFRDAIKGCESETFYLDNLHTDGMVDLVTEPAKMAQMSIEVDLVHALLTDAGAGNALPLLAFTLRKLWDGFSNNSILSMTEYISIGRIEGSIDAAAESALMHCPTELQILRGSLHSLVGINSDGSFSRARMEWKDVPDVVRPLFERLEKERLLVIGSDGRGKVVEASHEALFRAWTRLSRWLEEDRPFFLWHNRLTADYTDWNETKEKHLLLRGTRLAESLKWLEFEGGKSTLIAESEREFIGLSTRSESRRKRIAVGLSASVLVVSIAVTALLSSLSLSLRHQLARSEKQRDFFFKIFDPHLGSERGTAFLSVSDMIDSAASRVGVDLGIYRDLEVETNRRFGNVYLVHGNTAKASEMLRKSVEGYRQLYLTSPDTVTTRLYYQAMLDLTLALPIDEERLRYGEDAWNLAEKTWGVDGTETLKAKGEYAADLIRTGRTAEGWEMILTVMGKYHQPALTAEQARDTLNVLMGIARANPRVGDKLIKSIVEEHAKERRELRWMMPTALEAFAEKFENEGDIVIARLLYENAEHYALRDFGTRSPRTIMIQRSLGEFFIKQHEQKKAGELLERMRAGRKEALEGMWPSEVQAIRELEDALR